MHSPAGSALERFEKTVSEPPRRFLQPSSGRCSYRKESVAPVSHGEIIVVLAQGHSSSSCRHLGVLAGSLEAFRNIYFSPK